MAHRTLSRKRIGPDDRAVGHDDPHASRPGEANLLEALLEKLPEATPALDPEETEAFLRKVEEGLKHPTGLKPTPKLKDARSLFIRRARIKKRLQEIERKHAEQMKKAKRDAGKRVWQLAALCILVGLVCLALGL